ncbi:MAG: lamin tail domain-containing protein, partial [Anaerolineales bacterium]|nr:lamin tail domain-containing protein [Anaerolineales bacterium]
KPLAAADTDIVINEIHYDPDVKTEFSEFIELYNSGALPLDLSNWTLDGGVSFTFTAGTMLPAGGYLVIAQADPHGTFTSSFQDRFGFAPFAEFEGKLDNEGEKVTLRNALGEKVDEVSYEMGFPWPISGEGQSIELIHPMLDNEASGNWRSGGPTPGAVNTVFATNAPPDVRKVEHTPQEPTSADVVTITAKATDPDGVAAVSLLYQLVDPGSYVGLSDPAYTSDWTSLTMFDDGTNGDATAGDGVYTIVLPAGFQQHRRLVRYRISATDGNGAMITAPFADDPQPNFAYFVYDGVPNWSGAINPADAGALGDVVEYDFSTMQELPVYHLITDMTDSVDAQFHPYSSRGSGYTGSDYLWEGTLIYDGQVYDHIHYRARGGVWRYAMGKNMWKFDFNRGHQLQARDDYGRKYDTTWDKLNFSAIIQQGNFLHRGEQGLFESLGFKMFNLADVPATNTHFVHFRIIDETDEAGSDQYGGDFWGMYLAVEQLDGNFLDEHDLPDGNFYKMESWTGTLNNQGSETATDTSDLDAFLDGYGRNKLTVGPQQDNETWWRENLNLEQYYSYRSIVDAIHHYDIGSGKNYFYYLNPETNLWQVIPWDLDLTWANNMYIAWSLNTTPPSIAVGGDPFYQRTIYNSNIPIFNIEFQNRMREVRDLLYNSEQAEKMIHEEMAKIYTAGNPSFVDIDRARWDYNPVLIAHTNNGYDKNYVNLTKAGNGRYYQQPAGTADDNFEGMAQLMQDYVATRSDWIDGYILTDYNQVPVTPVISYIGTAGYPANKISFQTTPFSDPQTDAFAAMEWRIGEISYPGVAGHDPSKPWIYEATAVWESGELTSFNDTIAIAPGLLEVGHTYRARVRMQDSTGRWSHWSDPLEFTAAAPTPFPAGALVISEINYNPPGADDATEFIEIKNTSAETLDLSAVTVDGVGDYTFPLNTTIAPNEFIVLARYPALFEARYGFAPFNTADYEGNLQNSGEKVSLFDSGGITITTFVYADTLPWPAAPDGGGYSLVPVNPNSNPDPTDAVNWRTSTSLGGSPGKDDPTLSVNNLTTIEGNSNNTVNIEVALSAATGQGITTTVDYAAFGGTAETADYLPASGTITLTAGQLTATRPLTIVGDTTYEPDEWLYLVLQNNAGIATGQATATITNDDAPPTLSIGDSSATEGETVSFAVTLAAVSEITATVDYNITFDTADGDDLVATANTLTFAPGQTTQTINIATTDDAVYEPAQTFMVNLNNATGSTLADNQAIGTIIDDEAPPVISVDDVSVVEGELVTFTVTLSAASEVTATVAYNTADDTATATDDYQSASGQLSFIPGQTTQLITVMTNDDALDEVAEKFTLQLSNPAQATLGSTAAQATIIDNDGAPEITLTDISVFEGDNTTQISLTVTLQPSSEQTVTLDYVTADGTAVAGSDYTAATGSLMFAPGQTTQTIQLTIIGDTAVEADETFTLTLNNLTNAIVTDDSITITIRNDDEEQQTTSYSLYLPLIKQP